MHGEKEEADGGWGTPRTKATGYRNKKEGWRENVRKSRIRTTT